MRHPVHHADLHLGVLLDPGLLPYWAAWAAPLRLSELRLACRACAQPHPTPVTLDGGACEAGEKAVADMWARACGVVKEILLVALLFWNLWYSAMIRYSVLL